MNAMGRKKNTENRPKTIQDTMAKPVPKKTQLNVKMDEELRRKLHIRAKIEGRTAIEIVNELVEEWLRSKGDIE